ncbi:unnamed protein product [Rotaria socialis]|uniref:Uncharacterized protein n=1 Tax=Rotaria socialis TaxID=392032 RepID=A0A817YNY1_9BILA|nr:unnamed protein product [Rotaria socialis]CAF4783321.1 unnamed protein product [Rotaria socialis]
MPKLNKRRFIGRIYVQKRWYDKTVLSENDSESEREDITSDKYDKSEFIRFTDKMKVDDIGDLFELIKNKIGLKLVSVLLYMTLRYFGINWLECDEFFKKINGLKTETANKWANIFLSGSFNEFISEGRGGKHISSFYDLFPDIESSAKAYAAERCAAKAADFDAFELTKFIDEQFYMLTDLKKDPDDSLIRSVQSCRLDLRRWGARFESNSQRPYFEGNERQDAVQHRTNFLQYFLPRKDSYYLISEGSQPKWRVPTDGTPTILIFHDESTFRSGEVSAKRWLYGDQAPFYSKGRGRSNMLSDFLVMHPSGPFFYLSPSEYEKALEKYPDLDEEQDIDYRERSASASMNVGSGSYFDNSTILSQFERLFKLLYFKKCFNNHKIEIIVDNAHTHSDRAYTLFDFGKGISTRCPVDQLEWVGDKGTTQSLSCYFQKGHNRGKSKGLYQIAVELKCNPSPKAQLSELHQLLAHHPAFQNVILLSLHHNLRKQLFYFPTLDFHD